MILRDQSGEFIAGKVICLAMVNTVFEAEAVGIHEGLSWLLSMLHQKVVIESVSLLSLQAIKRPCSNELEVGHIYTGELPHLFEI